jgi:hypothetical protein
VLIERCTIRGMDSDGVLVQSGSAMIAGTSITRSANSGVRVESGADATIVDARLDSNGGYGLWVFDTAKAIVERSSITKNGSSGIYLYTGTQRRRSRCPLRRSPIIRRAA